MVLVARDSVSISGLEFQEAGSIRVVRPPPLESLLAYSSFCIPWLWLPLSVSAHVVHWSFLLPSIYFLLPIFVGKVVMALRAHGDALPHSSLCHICLFHS